MIIIDWSDTARQDMRAIFAYVDRSREESSPNQKKALGSQESSADAKASTSRQKGRPHQKAERSRPEGCLDKES